MDKDLIAAWLFEEFSARSPQNIPKFGNSYKRRTGVETFAKNLNDFLRKERNFLRKARKMPMFWNPYKSFF